MPIRFELAAPTVGLHVEMELRPFGDRWVAAAVISGGREIGVGADARGAVVASLGSLRPRVRAELLADLSLLEVSRLLLVGAMG